MVEYPERAASEKRNEKYDFLRRYRETKKNLGHRAESLKGKDEPRRRELLKLADNMNGRSMTTAQVRRKTAIARLEMVKVELSHRGNKNGKR